MKREIQDPVLRRVVEAVLADVDPGFDFVDAGPIALTPPLVSLASIRVLLVTTAGLHVKGDQPFRSAADPFGDTSFRVVPHGSSPFELDLQAAYVDQRHIPRDPEVALPMAALEALSEEGLVGAPAPRHISFSGGIIRPLPGLADSARDLIAICREDGVGAAVLIPSCPLCVQTACLLSRWVEEAGVPTVCLTLLPELTRIVGAPRTLALRFPFGAPCGDAGNARLHQQVLREALALLVEADAPGAVRPSALAWRR